MENDFKFQKLTPTNRLELGIYDSAMQYVFANEDIKNIAISGSYGAGKSSMFGSYEGQHPGKNFLHISLAHFEEQGEKSEDRSDGEVEKESSASVLEGKIINQLIHQIDPKRIIQTDFRIKKGIRSTDKREIWMVTLGVVLFLLCLSFLLFHAAWGDMINNLTMTSLQEIPFFTKETEAKLELIAGVILIVLSVVLIKWTITAQKERRIFRKLSLQGNEIEVFADGKDSESFFDRYLNEVLYLFENAEVDGIVFEDIDRYDNKYVFEKLREINFLLNQRVNKQIGKQNETQKKVIRFFYLLRDDIFISRDRVKFFDFIIPVVPVLSASNAYDKFIEFFEKDNILCLFDANFLKDISLYVDDMRILINVHNEFIVYYNELSKVSSGLNPTKLLAMIIYKNVYPKDFGELQISQGYVYTLFNSIEEIRQLELDKLNRELYLYKKEQEKSVAEISKDIDDLNAIYFVVDADLRVNGKAEGSFASRKEFVKEILNSNHVEKYSGGYLRSYDISEEKEKMEKNPEYIERRNAIEKRENGEIKRKITQLQAKIDKIKVARFKDILNRENSKQIFALQHIDSKNNCRYIVKSTHFPLIKYLIGKGYIDEQYLDYMSYFYENRMSRTDKAFLRGIIDKEKHAFDYKINNPKLVTEEIKLSDFEEKEVFNVDLLDFLLSNQERYEEQLKRFMKGLGNYEPAEFVIQYLKTGQKTVEFVETFNMYWTGACFWILTTDQFDDVLKRQYIIDTVCISPKKVIDENNREDIITHFIENSRDFLNVPEEKAATLRAGLEKLAVKFKYIDCASANKQLFEWAYQNERYDLNIDMVEVMLNYEYGFANFIDCRRGSYNLSLILSKEEEPLCKYVGENISVYLQRLFDVVEEIDENDQTICFVLNNGNVTYEQKCRYIEILTVPLASLKNITDKDLWGILLEKEKIEKNFENVLDYYFLSGNGLDGRLISFLNTFEDLALLEHKTFKEEYGEDAEGRFVNDILACNDIRGDIYEKILSESNGSIKSFNQEGLEESKVEILLRNNLIPINLTQLQFIREAYHEFCLSYIEQNIEEYTNIMTYEYFSSDELKEILEINSIDDSYKLRLLKFESNPISLYGKNYSEKVQKYIIQNNFDENDLQYLTERYHTMGSEVKEEIYQRATEDIADVLVLNRKIATLLCNRILESTQVSAENKILLLAAQCEKRMPLKNVKSALKKIQLNQLCELLEEKEEEVNIVNSSAHVKLLESFRNRGWILDFEVDKARTYLKVYGHIKKK